MPIIHRGKPVTPQANAAPRGPRAQLDEAELAAKRERRAAKRGKYQLLRKDKTPRDYQGIQVFVDGKEMQLTESSKFLLDMILADKET